MKNMSRRLAKTINNIDIAYLSHNDKQISDALYCVLYALDDGKSHTQAEICKEWLLPKTTVNSIIKKMETEGMILRKQSQAGREVYISLSPKGVDYARLHLDGIYKAEIAALRKTLIKYGDEFIDILEYYGKNLKDAFNENE